MGSKDHKTKLCLTASSPIILMAPPPTISMLKATQHNYTISSKFSYLLLGMTIILCFHILILHRVAGQIKKQIQSAYNCYLFCFLVEKTNVIHLLKTTKKDSIFYVYLKLCLDVFKVILTWLFKNLILIKKKNLSIQIQHILRIYKWIKLYSSLEQYTPNSPICPNHQLLTVCGVFSSICFLQYFLVNFIGVWLLYNAVFLL